MEKIASNFNFSTMEKILGLIEERHSDSDLKKLQNELCRFFPKANCRQVIYTNNTDKLFFGMRVYPVITANDAVELIDCAYGDSRNRKRIDAYYLELDSKLFDPMLGLTEKELTAIIIHEIGHIVYRIETIDEVKKQIDMYMVKSGDTIALNNTSKSYKELLAYGLKDSIMKTGSLFSKLGNDEIIADSYVVACGYGPYLETAIKKITTSATYLNKSVDNRLITMSWVLRLLSEFKIRRLPAIRMLNKAKQLTASALEEREIAYAANVLSSMEGSVVEANLFDNIKARYNKKLNDFKARGVKAIQADVYELNLRVRCANTESDLLYVIRTVNNDIAILKDYLTEDISDDEREDIYNSLKDLYEVREKAAKTKEVINPGDSFIQVIYTN